MHGANSLLGQRLKSIAMSVWRSAFGVRRITEYRYTYLLRSDISVFFMDDFEQFDAFQRCREFVRAVAEPLNRGAFSKAPGFSHLAAQDDVVDLLEFRGRF